MNDINDTGFLGYELLSKGFQTFARYLFKAIEGKPFVIEKLHPLIFQCFDDIDKGKLKRTNLNIAPRSGKTTLATYFVVYTLTKNPKSNIIYTSYSQSLLGDIANKIKNILEHPIYKALFPNNDGFEFEKQETFALDDFWRDYLIKNQNENIYSSKKIITKQGGVCLFNSAGSSITGFGCGIRGAKKNSGFLILDDINKIQDLHSQILRNKTQQYFKETLFTRLNDSNTPIINIQQRGHIDDLSGYLIKKYNFNTVVAPLLDKDGNCNLPKQYSPERVKELQVDNYSFQAQYQQSPIIDGGQVIKSEWFGYYDINIDYKYKKIVIAADTAISAKEHADYTCFLVGGVTPQNKLHILEIVHGRWEYPGLKQQAQAVYNRWQLDKRHASASAFFVENKASGQQLIQDFKKTGLPMRPIEVTKDKLARVEEVLDYIASGCVLLPQSPEYGNNKVLLNECEQFSRDMSHAHEDCCDTLVHLINNSIAKRKLSILEVL